jgi:hypothetical protein
MLSIHRPKILIRIFCGNEKGRGYFLKQDSYRRHSEERGCTILVVLPSWPCKNSKKIVTYNLTFCGDGKYNSKQSFISAHFLELMQFKKLRNIWGHNKIKI